MKCRLTRITDNGHTRTRVIEGVADKRPTLQENFVLIGESLDKEMDYRWIRTTAVQEILEQSEKQVKFKTRNTEYVFELLP